jgi:hypothetical protein
MFHAMDWKRLPRCREGQMYHEHILNYIIKPVHCLAYEMRLLQSSLTSHLCCGVQPPGVSLHGKSRLGREKAREDPRAPPRAANPAALRLLPYTYPPTTTMPDSTSYQYDLGSYHRKISTSSPESQTWFDRGLVWCYAFHHEESARCFERAISEDSSCAMAYWGVGP